MQVRANFAVLGSSLPRFVLGFERQIRGRRGRTSNVLVAGERGGHSNVKAPPHLAMRAWLPNRRVTRQALRQLMPPTREHGRAPASRSPPTPSRPWLTYGLHGPRASRAMTRKCLFL